MTPVRRKQNVCSGGFGTDTEDVGQKVTVKKSDLITGAEEMHSKSRQLVFPSANQLS